MKAFALKPLSLFACILAMQAARNSFADTQPAEANMTISNMQLQVHALPGNTGAASVSTAGYQVLEGYVINPPTFSNYDRTTATDPDPTVLLYSDFARSSGIIEGPLLNGSIYAWGIHQPGESYYAEAALSGAYYPKITPFTEVTLSGRVSAQLTGTVEDASSSFSTANISITFGRQSLWRYISLRAMRTRWTKSSASPSPTTRTGRSTSTGIPTRASTRRFRNPASRRCCSWALACSAYCVKAGWR